MRVIYHPAAETDLIESVRFYEQRVPGLGKEFIEAIDRAIAAIGEDPQRDHLRILTIKHHRRHPNYGQDRR
jgi:plasmid stabilization system protein ParE